MKKIFKYMIVALAGLTLLACSKEDERIQKEKENVPSVENFTYTIAVSGDFKTHFNNDHITWDNGDLIGWFINNDAADCSEINVNASPRTFDVKSTSALPANSTVYAYAPFYTALFADNPTKTAAPLSIPVHQDGLIYDAMPMVALPIVIADAKEANANTPIAEASFINLGAVIEYNVYTSNAAYGAEKVVSVTFTSNSNIAGDFTVDLTSVSESAIPSPSGLTKDSVTSTLSTATTVGGSKAAGIKVYQVIAPGIWSGTITVTTDAAVYEYQISKEFNRGNIKPLNVDLASANATRTSIIEYRLTAHQWNLTGVQEAGVGTTTSSGNKLTLNSNHTMSFDCSAHSGQTFDHTWVGGLIQPNVYGEVEDMSWGVSESGGKNYITVTDGFLLVFAQESMTGVYEIKELTDNNLTVEITTYGETWTLQFEAVNTTPTPTPTLDCPYWHEFANGDFGIGPVFDWGGYDDGYYYHMLTVPYVLNGATWSISAAEYFEWAGTQAESGWRHGIQLCTSGTQLSNFKLSSSSFPGVITKVTLGYNSGIIDNSSLSVSCKVGGAAFGSTVYHGDGDYEAVFTGSASGEIEITLNSSTNGAVYLYSVAVEYDPSGSPI